MERVVEDVKVEVCVWVCPNCHNYYGASSVHDRLADQINVDNQGNAKFSRAQCPDCHEMRVPCLFEIELLAKESVE